MLNNTLQPPRPLRRLAAELDCSLASGGRHATPSVFHQRHIGRICDHRAISPDEDLHRHAAENLAQADALLFGRVTYELMEAGWRPFARTKARPDWMQPWMEPFAHTIDAAKKYVVSSTLEWVD